MFCSMFMLLDVYVDKHSHSLSLLFLSQKHNSVAALGHPFH